MEMTEEELVVVEKINKLTQLEMASLYRFAPAGHMFFDATKPFATIFSKRFKALGGMTPKISKLIEW